MAFSIKGLPPQSVHHLLPDTTLLFRLISALFFFPTILHLYFQAIAKMLDGNPRGELVIKVTIACGILETLAVFLRLLARWRSKAAFAADDWWIVATLLPSYAMLAVGCLMVTIGGGGRHAATLSMYQIETFLKVQHVNFFTVLRSSTDRLVRLLPAL